MTPRTRLDPAAWRTLAASAHPKLLALWADTVEVHALFDGPAIVSVPVSGGAYPALSPVRPDAALFERMIHDLWGHRAEGGDVRPWLDHGAWPVHQPMSARPIPSSGAAEPLDPPPVPDGFITALDGPIRPGLAEPALRRVVSDGWVAESVEPRLGYAHKGVLLLMRGKSPRAAVRFVARLRGDASVAHSIAFARAAEDAAGTPAPPRAEAVRAVMADLEMAAAHLAGAARVCAACGRPSAFGQQVDGIRAAAAAAFGHRLMMDCVVPGGVAADLTAEGAAAIGAVLIEPAPVPAGLPPALHDAAIRYAQAARHTLQGLVDPLARCPPGPLTVSLPLGAGEGLGRATAADGEIWTWLRLDGGAIANVFAADPAWLRWPRLGPLPEAEAVLGLTVSGMDL